MATLCVIAALCTPAAGQAGEAAPPEPMATMKAYQAVDRWVRRWEVAGEAELPVARAAAVILRLDGEVIGRGIDVALRPEGDARVTAIAARAALEEAAQRLPIARDALYEESLREIAKRVTVSVELAGAMVPWSPKDWAEATLAIEPGLEGVAVRMGERTMAMFPIAMMVTKMEPAAAYAGLVSRLAGDPTMGLKAPAELARDHGVTFYRFRTSHIAQTRVGGAPEFLHRGGSVFEQKGMTARELQLWAAAMVDHLWEMRRVRGGHHGTWDPFRAEAAESASPREEALILLALKNYHGLVSGNDAASYRRRIDEWIAADLKALASDQETLDPGVAAVAWDLLERMRDGAGTQPRDDAELDALKERCEQTLRSASAKLSELDAGARYLVLAFGPRDKASRDIFETATRGELVRLGAANLPAALPWLGIAERRAATVYPGPFRDMRDLLWQHQLRAFELPAEQRDLAGAIVFTKAGPGQRLMPTWHMARPLAFVATMLGDERLTSDEEVPQELSRLLASLRFLRQLTAGEAEAHMYRSPEKAIGGVRASLWDQSMPPEATAMTLLAVCETIRSLERIEARRGEAAGEEGSR